MKFLGVEISLKQFFKSKGSESNQNLEFGGLNPLLAKQLSELETQIGQFVQVQYQLSEERQRMRSEMDLLKREVRNLSSAPAENPTEPSDEAVRR